MGGAVQKLQKIVIDGYRDRVKFRFHSHDDLEAAVAGHEPNHIIYPASIEMRKTGSRNVVAKLLSEIADRLLDESRSLGLPSGSPKEDAKLVVVEYLICSSFDLVGEQSRLKSRDWCWCI